MPAPEPVETADSKEGAQALQAEWAARLTDMGLGRTHGTVVRFIRLSVRAACWGVFIEPLAAPGLPCPCGQVHELSAATRVAYENITRGLPETMVISVDGRAWLVPRIFIAVHGLKADELPELAARYEFAEATT